MSAFRIQGQRGWVHDEDHVCGTFHTYDALDFGDGPRKVHVFVPRNQRRPLPVAYLHDGDAVFWPGGLAGLTWDAAGVLERMGKKRPKMILVAIHTTDRNAEYTHIDWSHGQRTWGKLPLYTEHIADRLKPFIDAAYNTLPDPRHCAVIGSSHGGLAAFWQATRRPDRFGFAACMSPSFFSGLDHLHPDGLQSTALHDSTLLTAVQSLLEDRSRRPHLWIDWGMVRDGRHHNAAIEHLAAMRGTEMVDLLEKSYGFSRQDLSPGQRPDPVELWVQADPDGEHDESSWQRRLPDVLRAFQTGWAASHN